MLRKDSGLLKRKYLNHDKNKHYSRIDFFFILKTSSLFVRFKFSVVFSACCLNTNAPQLELKASIKKAEGYVMLR